MYIFIFDFKICLFSCFLGYYIGASDKTLRGILGFKVKVNKE